MDNKYALLFAVLFLFAIVTYTTLHKIAPAQPRRSSFSLNDFSGMPDDSAAPTTPIADPTTLSPLQQQQHQYKAASAAANFTRKLTQQLTNKGPHHYRKKQNGVVEMKREALIVFPRAPLWERSFVLDDLFLIWNVTLIEHDVINRRSPIWAPLRPLYDRYVRESVLEEEIARVNKSFCDFAMRVVVFQTAHNSLDVSAMKRLIDRVQPHVAMSLSDESGGGWRQLKQLGNSNAKIILKQYAHRQFGTNRSRFKIIPLGYFNNAFPRGFESVIDDASVAATSEDDGGGGGGGVPELMRTLNQVRERNLSWTKDRSLIARIYEDLDVQLAPDAKLLPASRRYYNWVFAGAIKQDRQIMLDNMSDWRPNFQHAHHGGRGPEIPLKAATVARLYTHAKFAPIGRGYISLECFRIHEASRAGAIPIVRYYNEVEREVLFKNYVGSVGKLPPWIFVPDWGEGLKIAREIAANTTRLNQLQRDVVDFYKKTLQAARGECEAVMKQMDGEAGCV